MVCTYCIDLQIEYNLCKSNVHITLLYLIQNNNNNITLLYNFKYRTMFLKKKPIEQYVKMGIAGLEV